MGVTSLPDDSTIATGWFAGSYTFGAGEPNSTTLTNGAGYNGFTYRDMFIAKYNPNGTLAWAKRAGGSAGRNDGLSVTGLSDGSSVVTGYFTNTAVFGPGETNQISLVSNGLEDIFVARYNTDGSLLWAKKITGASTNIGYGITTLSDDSIILTGYFADSAIFGEGEVNQTMLTVDDRGAFIAKYDVNGNFIWAKKVNGPGNDEAYAAATLSSDIFVITGHFVDEISFDEGEPNEITLYSDGLADSFIAWYYPNGTLLEARHAAAGTESNSSRDIAAAFDDSVAITGLFRSSTVFGPGDPNETVLNHIASSDVFIALYSYLD